MIEDFLQFKFYIQIPENVTDEQLHELEKVTGRRWASGSHLWEFRPLTNKVNYICCSAPGVSGIRHTGGFVPSKPWVSLEEFLYGKKIEISDDEWAEILG